MLTGVENWARTPPMLLPVDPLPCAVSRSITSTFVQPSATRWQAMLDPTIPPPIRTTSAVYMRVAIVTAEARRRTHQCNSNHASGECRGKGNANQNEQTEPSENNCECGTPLDLANAGDPKD